MEFITMSFAEIIALQSIEVKDEDGEDIAITAKRSGKRKPINKGERNAQKKTKAKKKAKVFYNHNSLPKTNKELYAAARRMHHNTSKSKKMAKSHLYEGVDNYPEDEGVVQAETFRKVLIEDKANLAYLQHMLEWAEAHHELPFWL